MNRLLEYRTMWRFLISVGILFNVCDSQIDVKCRNDEEHEVDWYILYKLPSKENSNGLKYLYMDESTNGWQLSSKSINSQSGALANTLQPLFDYYIKKTEDFGFILYNDQTPDKIAPASFGHSKGVVMLDRTTGVWLSHSTPKFPGTKIKNFWPNSGSSNAQTFLCMTYSYEQFQLVALQLQYIHVYSFDYSIPKTFHYDLQCVEQKSCYPKRKPWDRKEILTTLKGCQFLSFAKYTRFKDDLYSGLLANRFKEHLYVKSWGRMRNPLPSNCSTDHHVYNVKQVKPPPNFQPFSDTFDHSKWCVTENETTHGWTCIADMNREESQKDRGGGAICTNNTVVWKAFHAMVGEFEGCPSQEYDAQTREL